MRLIVLSEQTLLENEAETISKLFESGLECFHLRKRKISTQALEKFIEQIPAKYHNRIVLHSHFRLTKKFNVKGVHFSSKRRKSRWEMVFKLFFMRLRKPGLSVSTSFSNISSLRSNERTFSYILFGPVFDTLTKSGYHPSIIVQNIQGVIKKIEQHPVYAMGGVEEKNIEKVKELGFYGMAVSGAIWNAPDRVNAFLDLKHKVDKVYSGSSEKTEKDHLEQLHPAEK